MSDTPKTDEAVYEEDTGYNGLVKVVSPAFARDLERDNTRLRLRCEALIGVIAECRRLHDAGHAVHMRSHHNYSEHFSRIGVICVTELAKHPAPTRSPNE